tara:strand:- start:101 stop:1015 length:915 start_codon:yes stop_codon:yes gene_type:complete
VNAHERFRDYAGDKCWQAHVSDLNRQEDMRTAGLSEMEVAALRIEDFEFEYVSSDKKDECQEIKLFIQKHEWLGKLPNRPTHRFTARLKKNGKLAGTIIMAVPNAFSNLLGRENKNKEKLISRGACISWAPKNLGSWLISSSIKWMVKNTEFRYFTAYSDPEARELGTIYQACNFIYLGQTSGTAKQYLDPAHPEKGWFSDREFRKKSKYYRYAAELGIDKETWRGWMKKYSPNWDIIPPDIKVSIKEREHQYRLSCQCRVVPAKHKYVYILGRSKKETKFYKNLFEQNNPKKVGLPYPSLRGQ